MVDYSLIVYAGVGVQTVDADKALAHLTPALERLETKDVRRPVVGAKFSLPLIMLFGWSQAAVAGTPEDRLEIFDEVNEVAAPSPGTDATFSAEERCASVEGAYRKAVCEEEHSKALESWKKQLFVFEGRCEIEYSPEKDEFTIKAMRILDGSAEEDEEARMLVAMASPPPKVTRMQYAGLNRWLEKLLSPIANFRVRVPRHEAETFEEEISLRVFGTLKGKPQRTNDSDRHLPASLDFVFALVDVHGIVFLRTRWIDSGDEFVRQERVVLAEKWFTAPNVLLKRFATAKTTERDVLPTQEPENREDLDPGRWKRPADD